MDMDIRLKVKIPVRVNGQEHKAVFDATVAELLDELALDGKRVAVERNGAIVPHSQHAHVMLVTGDRIEIVHAIGGG